MSQEMNNLIGRITGSKQGQIIRNIRCEEKTKRESLSNSQNVPLGFSMDFHKSFQGFKQSQNDIQVAKIIEEEESTLWVLEKLKRDQETLRKKLEKTKVERDLIMQKSSQENMVLKEQQMIRIAIIKKEETLKDKENNYKEIIKECEDGRKKFEDHLDEETNNLEKIFEEIKQLENDKQNYVNIIEQKQEESLNIIKQAMIPLEAVQLNN